PDDRVGDDPLLLQEAERADVVRAERRTAAEDEDALLALRHRRPSIHRSVQDALAIVRARAYAAARCGCLPTTRASSSAPFTPSRGACRCTRCTASSTCSRA